MSNVSLWGAESQRENLPPKIKAPLLHVKELALPIKNPSLLLGNNDIINIPFLSHVGHNGDVNQAGLLAPVHRSLCLPGAVPQ